MAETRGMTDEPNVTNTDRGFKHLDAVPGSYGGEVRIYESSGVTPAIWLNAKSVKELDDDGKYLAAPVPQDAIVLLTLANARTLRDQLTWLIDNHYLAGEPEDEDDDG